MDREHVKGAADKAKGSIKETAGKITGDKELQSEGKIRQGQGRRPQRCWRRERRSPQTDQIASVQLVEKSACSRKSRGLGDTKAKGAPAPFLLLGEEHERVPIDSELFWSRELLA